MSQGLSPQRLARNDARLRLYGFGVLLLPLALALAASFYVTPDEIDSGQVALTPPCLTKSVLGHECPTCGMTRAFAAISHGQLLRGVGYNRAAPLAYAAFWLALGYASFGAMNAIRDFKRARAR